MSWIPRCLFEHRVGAGCNCMGGVSTGASGCMTFLSVWRLTPAGLAPSFPGERGACWGDDLWDSELSSNHCVSASRTKPQKKAGGGSAQLCDSIVVAYYFCGEPIPYRTLVRGRAVTLGQFKELLTKKGNYR